jgi:hypothetical protein
MNVLKVKAANKTPATTGKTAAGLNGVGAQTSVNALRWVASAG